MRRIGLVFCAVAAFAGCTMSDDSCEGLQADGFRCSIFVGTDSDVDTSSGEPDTCFADDPAAILKIENRAGNAVEIVYFTRCDGTDASEFPLMPPGLPNGEDVEIPLPAPGCWILGYSGEGCENHTPHETPMNVCAGDTYVWTLDELDHECVG